MLPSSDLVRTILVVDCDGSLTEAAVPVLAERGYNIHRASDASGAMWILRQTQVDLLIVDNCVEDAHELLEAKANDPELAEIRVVLVTVGATEIAPVPGMFHEAVMPASH
jgi:DNA-binding NtrC family response regulator